MRKGIIVLVIVFMVLGLWIPMVMAKEPMTQEVSLNEAIAMAINNSKAVKKADLGIDKASEQRDYTMRELRYTPIQGGAYDPRMESALYNAMSTDLQWQMSKRAYDAEEDRLVLDACQKYWNVQKAIINLQSKETALLSAERMLRQIRVMNSVGMATRLSIVSAEGRVTQAKAFSASAQNELNSAYEAFNQLVGLWPQDRPDLNDILEFKFLGEESIDIHVQRVIESSPSVWLAEESVRLAGYMFDPMWLAGQHTPYRVKQIEVERAQLDALSAKDAIKLITRNIYYNIQSMEEAYTATEQAVMIAEEALRVGKLSYQLGLITQAELLEHESNLAETEYKRHEVATQHAYMKLAYQKPWAMAISAEPSAQ